VIAQRLSEAKAEMSHYHEFDYLVINNHFDTALKELHSIFKAKRLCLNKQLEEHASLIENLCD